MVKKLLFSYLLAWLFIGPAAAQHRYYKNPDSTVVRQFKDSLNRTVLLAADSSAPIAIGGLMSQFNYLLGFYPKMLVGSIRVEFKNSIAIARVKPQFSSIFKAPKDRVYKITFSKSTQSTLDSVMISKLSYNAQLGLIAMQVSHIEDFSTGGLLNFLGWYIKRLSRKARNKMDAEAELKTLEVGLGYQLLALNKENAEKLKIDNWQNTRGYASYVKYTRNRAMKPEMVSNFISDLPIYITQQYK
jgi:hypothetical protein